MGREINDHHGVSSNTGLVVVVVVGQVSLSSLSSSEDREVSCATFREDYTL